MNPSEKKKYSFPYELESPFMEENLQGEDFGGEEESQVSAVESESPFYHGLESDRQYHEWTEPLQAEWEDEEMIGEDELDWEADILSQEQFHFEDEADAYFADEWESLDEIDEAEEAEDQQYYSPMWPDENSSYESWPYDAESSEAWFEPEEEEYEFTAWQDIAKPYDAEPEADEWLEAEEDDEETQLFELEKSASLAVITDFADRLGREWAERRGGSPPADKISDWLLRDYQDTMTGARKRFKTRFTDDAIGRAWMISREEQMKFQIASLSGSLKSMRHIRPPSRRVTLVSSELISGSNKAPVAPIIVRFVQVLHRRYSSPVGVSTYRNHGGGKFNNRGYSIDLFLHGRDARGFYPPEEAVRFLRALDQAASDTNSEWRAIYNDFSVADTINRETGREHVIFVGKVRKKNNRVYNINWHGPHPLILHFHLDLAPRSGAEQTLPSLPPAPPRPSKPPRKTARPPAETIRFAQRVLNAAEGERLDDDGLLGRLTRAALSRFRTKYRLGPGGVLDDKTQLALVQRALEEIRQQSLFANLGIFDAVTRDALSGFKAAHGLGGNAVLDASTRAALTGALTRRRGTAGAPSGNRTGSTKPLPSTTPDALPGRLGSLVLRRNDQIVFRYAFTPDDLLWTARLISGEAGARDDLENRAVMAAMLNRFALFTHRVYRTFTSFIRAYSTPLQPVLRNKNVARHYMNDPRFVRLGGTYKGTDIPRGQLKRHLELQKTPWHSLRPLARKLALEALTGNLPDTGIGLASEFASTWMLYGRRVGSKNRTEQGWLDYTRRFKRHKGWRWIGHRPHLNQKRNAFFLDPRAVNLPADAVQVVPPE